MKHLILIFISFALIFNNLFAGDQYNLQYQKYLGKSQIAFTENQGQLADEKGNLLNDIKFYGNGKGVSVYCRENKLSFVFTKIVKTVPDKLNNTAFSKFDKMLKAQSGITSATRMDMEFLNANPNAKIISGEKQEIKYNFYLAQTPENGITNISSFKKLVYEKLYPDIDLILECKESGLEYSFIVHPGGNVSDIQIQWKGNNTNEVMQNGEIHHVCSLGEINESKPVSMCNNESIASYFSISSNITSFKIANYDKSKDLVIDPEIKWATYFGGGGWDVAYSVVLDDSSNIYFCGVTCSSRGVATKGVYDTTLKGGFSGEDAFLAKFNNKGGCLWATYYGGNEDEEALMISINNFHRICITGFTRSRSGIATKGAFDTILALNTEGAFLAEFSGSGKRIWSTYFTGSEGASGSAVSQDIYNNIYITGATISTSGIATKGAYDTTLSGRSDVFLAKFDSSGNQVWSTYYGGSDIDNASTIAIDSLSNIYIAGETMSSNGIATSGAYQKKYQGNFDIFLAKFSTSGKLLWGTYYGGKEVEDCNAMTLDSTGVYITGETPSKSGIATPGSYISKYQGDTDAFLVKFSLSGSLLWGTYIGSSTTVDYSFAITHDDSNNVYIGGDTNDITTGYFVKFNKMGVFKNKFFYFGGIPHSMVMDHSFNIYAVGTTINDSGLATKGAYDSIYSDSNDAFVVKFGRKYYNNDAGIRSIDSIPLTSCPNIFNIYTKLINEGTDTLKSAIIHWSINGVVQTSYNWSGNLSFDKTISVNIASYNFNPGGSYKIKTWTSNPNGALKDSNTYNDTVMFVININAAPSALLTQSGDTLIASGGSSIVWYKDSILMTGITNLKYIPVSDGHYFVKITNSSGCYSYSNSIVISLFKILKGKITQSNGNALNNSYVYLIKFDKIDTTFAPIDSIKTDANGYYLFSLGKDSILYLLALPDTGLYHDQVPTYYTAAIDFQDADSVYCKHDTTIINFSTLQGGNPGGSGYIRGKVVSCLICKSISGGRPIPHLRILIVNSKNELVSYTYTDKNGIFQFKNIPLQSYKVLVDKPYIIDSLSPSLTLTSAITSLDSQNFILYPTYLSLNTITSIEEGKKNIQQILIYPNPFTGFTNIEYTISGNEMVKAEVYDIFGRRVVTLANEEQISGKHSLKFEGNGSMGQYILRMQLGDEVIYKKIVEVK